MHTYFNFSFTYPVTQTRIDEERKGGLRYEHVMDLTINGRGYKKQEITIDASQEYYDYNIEEILSGDINIYPLLESTNGLDIIKKACLHHINHMAFSQKSESRISYIPLRKAV